METIKLNLIPTGSLPVVHTSQYDEGRVFRIELFEGSAVYTLDGTEFLECDVKKPDGNIVTIAVVNTSDNYVDVETTLQMNACAGESFGELHIKKGAQEIGTLNFILAVERSPLENGIQSDSGIHNLQTQIGDAVADQYAAEDVVFDATPTAGHGVGFAVTSEGVKNALDAVAATIPEELDDLQDVTTSSPTSGEALVWDGSKWTNGTVSTVGSIDDLNDVDTTGKANADSLRYNATAQEWEAKPTTVEMTLAEYEALGGDYSGYENTNIVITDAPNLNATAQDISYDGGVKSTYDMIEPDLKFNANRITIYQTGNIITVGFMNASIDNVLSALSSYATTYDIRFIVWNATKARENVISLKTTPICIDTNPWGGITGTDDLHGGFSFILK